ncbi:MAG TPA: hypothetical protein VK595_02865 [Vicinamibacterales bacterium]|nr:hypothetical protein [Vicinamibacterales bacterium]
MTSSSSEFHPPDSPRISIADVQRLAAGELSLPSRFGHALLLVVSLTMAVAIGSLWATESSLPMRTQAAFALIVIVALAWSVFAAWVLTRRRVLFGSDRVVAATMGLAFSALFTAGMLAAGYWAGFGRPAYAGALVESLFCGVAGVLLVRARRRVAAFARRRKELERQLGMSGC